MDRSLKSIIAKVNKDYNLGLSGLQQHKIKNECLDSGYENKVTSYEIPDIRDVIKTTASYLKRTNPLLAIASDVGYEEPLCPQGGEELNVIRLADNSEALYCQKHHLTMPIKQNG